MRASRCYRSLITKPADLVPCSSLQCDACEQMLQITNHSAKRTNSMQFPSVRCLRADATVHLSHSLQTYIHSVPCSVMRASRGYRSLITKLADLVPWSSQQCDACEQMLQITNHTASRLSPMLFLQCDACEKMLQITNHTARKPSSMQYLAVRCVRADATHH
jgi:hypothetical protein